MQSGKMLYANITELCSKNHMSVRSLEAELGFSNGMIQGWKRNNPRLESLMNVASYFHVSLDSLVGFNPETDGASA